MLFCWIFFLLNVSLLSIILLYAKIILLYVNRQNAILLSVFQFNICLQNAMLSVFLFNEYLQNLIQLMVILGNVMAPNIFQYFLSSRKSLVSNVLFPSLNFIWKSCFHANVMDFEILSLRTPYYFSSTIRKNLFRINQVYYWRSFCTTHYKKRVVAQNKSNLLLKIRF